MNSKVNKNSLDDQKRSQRSTKNSVLKIIFLRTTPCVDLLSVQAYYRTLNTQFIYLNPIY